MAVGEGANGKLSYKSPHGATGFVLSEQVEAVLSSESKAQRRATRWPESGQRLNATGEMPGPLPHLRPQLSLPSFCPPGWKQEHCSLGKQAQNQKVFIWCLPPALLPCIKMAEGTSRYPTGRPSSFKPHFLFFKRQREREIVRISREEGQREGERRQERERISSRFHTQHSLSFSQK